MDVELPEHATRPSAYEAVETAAMREEDKEEEGTVDGRDGAGTVEAGELAATVVVI
jgi:hypothetical protein